MRLVRAVAALLAIALIVAGCGYVVLPPEASARVAAGSKGWTALPTSVGPADDGDLRIELSIRNETGAWSAMEAAARPSVLTAADGKTTECATVKVGSGGHRLAPGMQMRGYQAGPKKTPTTELIRVECAGATAGPGSKLALDYRYVTGDYNYYDPAATQTEARLEVALDPLAAGLQYPIAEPIDGLVQPADTKIAAINGLELTLADVKRTDSGLEFDWRAANPGEYPASVHIGEPPVIGSDGILYGYYESPDLASVPVTKAGGEADWTTKVAVPKDVSGLVMMLSVESKKQRLFVNYALDLGGA